MAGEVQYLFKRTTPKRDFAKLSKLIYGWPKSGKSTFAAQQIDADGREPLFITSEDGHDALGVFAQRVTSWNGLSKLSEDILKNAEVIKQQHSCFVLDLISDFDIMCAETTAKKNNVVHLADLDFGKGWALQKQEFQRVIKELMLVLPCTFIAHSADKELMWNNEKIKVQAPSLSKGALEFINGKVDVIAWMTPSNNKKEYPEVVMKNTLTSIAGSRHRQLCRSFTFYPENPARTYGEIQKAFANEKEVSVESKNPSPQRVGAQTQADATTA